MSATWSSSTGSSVASSSSIPRLVRQVAPGDIGRAAVVAGHARLVLGGLDLHHTGEDALLWPKLLDRDPPRR